jgi:cytochrome b subunit of formate dehydrogenase
MMLKRFSWHQRVAHFVGSVSGMMLLLTGLPIMFPNQLRWLMDAFGGSAVTMFLHRLFAIILIFSFAYFGTYFILERITKGRGDSNIKNFGFSASFISEVVAGAVRDILWTLGLRKDRPKFGKYDWIMVADIFLMPLLALVEIITGAIMWFPRSFPFIVENPGLFFTIRAIHAGVAFFLVLFVLAHAGILHLTPGNFPINMSIFNGLMSKKKAMHEHPNWVPLAEEVGAEEIESKTHPICYLFGAITIINIALLAYIPFIMYSEGFAGLRIGDNVLASVGLGLAVITLIIYIIASIIAFAKGVAKRV